MSNSLLIDCTNIKYGGGLQASVSVINELLNICDHKKICFALSSAVAAQLSIPSNIKFLIIDTKLQEQFYFSKKSRSLARLSELYDVTFTIFGPGHWIPHSKKVIVGFANAWIVNPRSIAYKQLSTKDKIITKLKNFLLGKLLYRNDYYYVTETEDVRKSFIEYFNARSNQIFVVPNTLPYVYSSNFLPLKNEFEHLNKYLSGKFKFVTISHNYPHKNLNIITEVGELFHKNHIDVIFIVTINESEYSRMPEKFKRYTYNCGPLTIQQSKELYSVCDALFLPTLIECFSVSYLEAMFHKIPIFTSNMDFAKYICKSAAVYFDPFSPLDIFEKIKPYVVSPDKRSELVKGYSNIEALKLTCTDRTNYYLEIIANL